MAGLATDQQNLTQFWVRMDRLTQDEWADFYRCVRAALLRCPAPELSGLPDRRENYIDEFFTEKLFFRAQRTNELGIQSISGGALCTFFRRYLIDLLRAYQRISLTEKEDLERMPEDTAGSNDEAVVSEFLATSGGHEVLRQSVADFLATLEEWGLLMLRGHFCADDDAVPMSSLCKGIPSYHYKAQKLGITVNRSAAELLGYEHTIIGRWIVGMGVAVIPQNFAVIQFLLGAICLEAAATLDGDAP
jgi:hypothetical protein